MTCEFTHGHPQRLPACNFLSQYYFITFSYKRLATLAKFEATKTGSGVGFLRLTAVWARAFSSPEATIILVSTSMCRVLVLQFSANQICRIWTRPLIADFRCWERPVVSILGADQKDRGLWEGEWGARRDQSPEQFVSACSKRINNRLRKVGSQVLNFLAQMTNSSTSPLRSF